MPKDSRNGFQEALTAVLNTQAAMQQTMAATQQTVALLMKQMAEHEAAIRGELSAIRAILVRHEEILQGLPEALQRRIGYQGPIQP